MKSYFFLVRSRLKSRSFLRLISAWHILRLKKLLKLDFNLRNQTNTTSIDLVIPTISKDFDILKTVIDSAKKHVINNIETIYIVSIPDKFLKEFCKKHGYILIDELDVLGYGKNTISYSVNGVDRSGWMFQQLLKLSGDEFVKNKNYLIIDSDTVLLNPHTFIEGNKFVFLQNEEWHEPYFTAFRKLFNYPAVTSLSYTSHMMIFNTSMLKKMKAEIEAKHKKSWDKVYTDTANSTEPSCISDYDTYANWVRCNFPDMVVNRVFYNRSVSRSKFNSLENLELSFDKKYNSISFHNYIK